MHFGFLPSPVVSCEEKRSAARGDAHESPPGASTRPFHLDGESEKVGARRLEDSDLSSIADRRDSSLSLSLLLLSKPLAYRRIRFGAQGDELLLRSGEGGGHEG